jgi:tRNA-specific 2-thiouridylase
MKAPFKKAVVDYFLKDYQVGRTPNPCVECNRSIKFGDFFKKVKAMGADYVATGHYVRLWREIRNLKSETLNVKLLKGKDKKKDQSYFLYTLTQNQLKYCLFPIGEYTKQKVREIAKKYSLPVFNKKDSQEVCFVGDGVENFLKRWLKMKKGKIIELETKKVLGEHQGLPLYTIGQRKGLGFGGGPYYVIKIDVRNNVLFVSKNEKEIFGKELKLKKINFIAGTPKFPLKVKTKIRYGHKAADATLVKEKNVYKIIFDKPQRAITPGQSAVFYRGEEVVGGGVICV